MTEKSSTQVGPTWEIYLKNESGQVNIEDTTAPARWIDYNTNKIITKTEFNRQLPVEWDSVSVSKTKTGECKIVWTGSNPATNKTITFSNSTPENEIEDYDWIDKSRDYTRFNLKQFYTIWKIKKNSGNTFESLNATPKISVNIEKMPLFWIFSDAATFSIVSKQYFLQTWKVTLQTINSKKIPKFEQISKSEQDRDPIRVSLEIATMPDKWIDFHSGTVLIKSKFKFVLDSNYFYQIYSIAPENSRGIESGEKKLTDELKEKGWVKHTEHAKVTSEVWFTNLQTVENTSDGEITVVIGRTTKTFDLTGINISKRIRTIADINLIEDQFIRLRAEREADKVKNTDNERRREKEKEKQRAKTRDRERSGEKEREKPKALEIFTSRSSDRLGEQYVIVNKETGERKWVSEAWEKKNSGEIEGDPKRSNKDYWKNSITKEKTWKNPIPILIPTPETAHPAPGREHKKKGKRGGGFGDIILKNVNTNAIIQVHSLSTTFPDSYLFFKTKEDDIKIIDYDYFETWRLQTEYKEGSFNVYFTQDGLRNELSEMTAHDHGWLDKLTGERCSTLEIEELLVYDYYFHKLPNESDAEKWGDLINSIIEPNLGKLPYILLDGYQKTDNLYTRKFLDNRSFVLDIITKTENLPNRTIDYSLYTARTYISSNKRYILESKNSKEEKNIIGTKPQTFSSQIANTLGFGRGGKSLLKKRTRKRGKRSNRRYSRKR